jgi:hypothetical protein
MALYSPSGSYVSDSTAAIDEKYNIWAVSPDQDFDEVGAGFNAATGIFYGGNIANRRYQWYHNDNEVMYIDGTNPANLYVGGLKVLVTGELQQEKFIATVTGTDAADPHFGINISGDSSGLTAGIRGKAAASDAIGTLIFSVENEDGTPQMVDVLVMSGSTANGLNPIVIEGEDLKVNGTITQGGNPVVTSVTGTAPINVTAGATPVVSLTLATDSGLQNNSGLDLDIVSLGSPTTTSPTTADSLAFHLDGSDTKRILFGDVNLSSFNNDLTAIVTSVGEASTQGGGSASGLTITGTSAVLAGIMYAGGGAENLFNAAPQWVDETLVGADELLVGDAGDALAVPFEQIPVSLFDTGNFVESNVNETITGNWTFPNTTDIGVTTQSYDTLAATDWDRGVGTHVFVNAGSSTGNPSGATRGYWFTMGRRDVDNGYAGLYLELGNTLWLGQRDDNSTDGAPTWVEVANVGHEHSAADITSGTLGVTRGGTGLTAEVGNDELLVSNGSGNGYEGSVALTYNSSTGLNLAGTGLDISITGTGRFEGNGSGLTSVSSDSVTLAGSSLTTGTYYPMLTPDTGGDAALYVDSSDLRWNATDSQLLTADGANGSPSYAFISDPDTGMFLDAVGTLSLTTAGAVRLNVNSTAIEARNIPIRVTASTSGHVGHTGWSANTYITSNLYYGGSGDRTQAVNWRYISGAGASSTAGWALHLAANGGETGQSVSLYSVPTSTDADDPPTSFTERLRITSAQMLFGDGTQADPAYSFLDDDNTGMYRVASNDIGFSVGGALGFRVTASYVYPYKPIRHVNNGSAAAPSYAFNNDPDTGMYLVSAGNLGFSVGNANKLQISSDGVDVTGTLDATVDVTVSSDIRLKNELPDIVQGLEVVDKLRPIKYTLKDDEDENPKIHLGFSAQELLDIVPEVVRQGNDDYYSVAYQKLVPVLVKAIQELAEEVRELKKKVGE